jgi:hemerythrin-like domain-containing protein
MKVVETLKHEHRVIEHGLAVLEAIADRLEREEAVPQERVAALLGFFRDFADGCHHAKEEGLLFPELEAKGMPREEGPIGVMLQEHEQGRALQQQLRTAAERLEEAEACRQFVRAAREYSALLREHIRKENGVLFPLAEQMLSEADDEELVAGFERHEQEHMGKGVHERLHQLIHELEALCVRRD